ncbi:MAG: RsiV family protein, partial [Mediterranea sp.]|nr:RsiV family protein [Mediterranea sp.]
NLEPTENFFLGEKGITFYYNIYDITPYVMGPVQITLSYDAVRPLLREEAVANYDL